MPANGFVQACIDDQKGNADNDKAPPLKPLIPNAETITAMKEAENGPLPRFDSIEAFFEDLNADD
jgi:antitoxin component of RelBE/YafQ-DinJ toxin-antitoxin module